MRSILPLFAIVAAVAADQLNVLHRIVLPSRPLPPFTARGSIDVVDGDQVSFRQLDSASKDLQSWLEGLSTQKGYYQLAVQRSEDDNDQGSWNIQSVHIVRWQPALFFSRSSCHTAYHSPYFSSF